MRGDGPVHLSCQCETQGQRMVISLHYLQATCFNENRQEDEDEDDIRREAKTKRVPCCLLLLVGIL
jgi:hypothetical protein